MRIVHCEDSFHPDTGYQLNILPRYMQSKGHEVIILTSELDKTPTYLTDFFGLDNIQELDQNYTRETGVKIIRLPVIAQFSRRLIYYPGYFKKLDSLNTDIAYIHGNDSYLGIRSAWRAKKFKYPILFDSHMAEGASTNPLSSVFKLFYRTLVTPFINKNRITVIRTADVDFVIKHYGIDRELTPYIGFGSNLQLFHPDASARHTTRESLGILQDDFVVVYAGKLDEHKGGLFLAEAVKEKITTEKNLTFLIIGNIASIDDSYKQRVEETLSISQNKIVRLPTQAYSKLNKFFQCADLAVFPKQCSLTFFDAQACGLPVVLEDGFDINIQRLQYNNGVLYKSGDIEDFRAKITMLANLPNEKFKSMKESAEKYIVENYNYDDIANKYLEMVTQVVTKGLNA